MDLKIEGKRALVTGATAGIGRAIARGLAAEGVKVVLAARRRELLEEISREIVGDGGAKPDLIETDLTQKGAAKRLAEAASVSGPVEILINSAGGSHGAVPIDTDTEAEWEWSLTLNFIAVRQLSHAVLPGMIEKGWGRIVNITGKSELNGLAPAAASKAATHAWSKGLSNEVGHYGITVNCIAPGRIVSEQILRKYSDEFRAKESRERIPLGRYGEAAELAQAALFLASEPARYITGIVLPVDGGMRRYAF